MADGRHFENRYSSVSQPRIIRIWRYLVRWRKYWARRRKRDKNSEIPKFKMADRRHIENHFLAITRLHTVRVRRNLEFGDTITHTQRLENDYIFISQPQIVRFSRNLVRWHKFYPRRRKRDKIEIPKFKMADGRHIENHFFGYNSAPSCQIKTKFRVRRHNRADTMMKMPNFENPTWRTAAILKIIKSPYLSRKSSVLHEI